MPPRGACQRGQSGAPAGALSGAPRRRADLIVPNRVGRRPRRARPARPLWLPLGGSIDTFDDLFERLAAPTCPPLAGDAERALVVRRAVADGRSNDLPLGPARAALPTLSSRVAELERASSTRATWTATWRRCTGPTAPSSTGSASGTGLAPPPRRGAARDRARRLARRARFAYGFEDLTGADGRCSRRWRGAPTSRSHCRTSRVASCSRPLRAPPTISPSLPFGPRSKSSPPRVERVPSIRRSRISSARYSTSRRPRRRRSMPPCAFSRERGRAGRSSSSARSCSN